ncbi:MAG: ATP-binding protein [Pikeienuella sp.]
MTAHTEAEPRLSPRWMPGFVESGRFSGRAVVILAVFGGVLAVATTYFLNAEVKAPRVVAGVLLADVAYLILLFGLIAWRIIALIGARRASMAGAQLHLRLTGIFALVAMAPTIIVAIFATISLSFGLESWFSKTVGSVVNNALITAEAYEREHRRSIKGDVLNMANNLNRAGPLSGAQGTLGELLRNQQALHRFPEAYLIDGAQEILNRGEFSYTFTYDPPGRAALTNARLGEVVLLEDQVNNELRALVYLNNFVDTFLYVTRRIDGEVLLLLDETAITVATYNKAEASRERLLSVFALAYIGFALLVITSAVWLGLWFAERLSGPIGALAGAAQRVGAGDLDYKVPETDGGDEVALLSRVFNRMTAQVKEQRDDLIESHQESESRRNFIETVLSGVSAGVVGLDENGRIETFNAAAATMLGIPLSAGQVLVDIAPAVVPVFDKAKSAMDRTASDHVRTVIDGQEREFLARVAATSSETGDGFVLTLDDLTALVSAQREAAWGDVARRIAHEIKNPLTPIQLSAERLRRKYASLAGEDQANFEQYADVIIRQAGDIRRMVDEFSKFARMPEPEAKLSNVTKLVQDAVLLQRAARPDIAFSLSGDDTEINVRCDTGMISQALTNLIKNAAEAIDSKNENNPDEQLNGQIFVTIETLDGRVSVIVDDNGVGLPKADRARLTEPYVTTRRKGSGLGLAIVKKIAEQHGGALTLTDAPLTDEMGAPLRESGARVQLSLPLAPDGPASEERTRA